MSDILAIDNCDIRFLFVRIRYDNGDLPDSKAVRLKLDSIVPAGQSFLSRLTRFSSLLICLDGDTAPSANSLDALDLFLLLPTACQTFCSV